MYIEDEYKHQILSAYSYAAEKYHTAYQTIVTAEFFDITPRYNLSNLKMLQKDAERRANHIDDMNPYLYEELERDPVFMKSFHNMQDMVRDEKAKFWARFDKYMKFHHLYDDRQEYWNRREVMEDILED